MRRVILFLFSFIILSMIPSIAYSRIHREMPTRKVRHHGESEETIASSPLKSTKSPKKQKKKESFKSSKSPMKNQGPKEIKSSKYDHVHQRSTKMPVMMIYQEEQRRHSKDPLPFMYIHAESLEDLHDMLLLGSSSIDKNEQSDLALDMSSPMLLEPVNASIFDCTDNYDFLTIDGFDCRWIDAEDIRRQEYCSDASVQSNCPRVCGKCCQDDPDFAYEFTKDCEWLRNPNTDSISVERQCAKQVVQNACPVGCGLCDINDVNCTDDPVFIIKTEMKDCAWLSTVSVERKEKVCTRLLVQDACQVTCNMCRPNVSTHPSMEPSFGPSEHPSSVDTKIQVTEGIPSYQPSVNPSSSTEPTDSDCEFPPRDRIKDLTPCVDDPTYITPFGGDCGCELFQGTDCNAWGALLDEGQLQEVWERCPVSCGVICENLDMACIDDDTYKSPANSKFGCEIYDGNCLTLWVSFLTSEEIEEALKRCPASCGVPCTSTPSTYPSLYPSGSPSRRTTSAVPSYTPSSSDLTISPTVEHHLYPSEYPTYVPSANKSRSPTPTLQTSSKPSVLPSMMTFFYPSVIASTQPSSQPTLSPTDESSDIPTSSLSILPTITDSIHPTFQHSVHPSIIPTQASSGAPSIDPTAQPSSSPTIHKSESPSNAPTVLPTIQQSVHPSIIPTQASSDVPSIDPTVQPSSSPTIHKSESPSNAPTVLPTIQQSVHPSIIPTQASSDVPSIDPTAQPSSSPTIHKSESPSNPPTGLPTIQQSVHPSIIPTQASSDVPSIDPTAQPSSSSTIHKSETPSKMPISEPSINPSFAPSTSPSASRIDPPTTISNSEFPTSVPTSLSSIPTNNLAPMASSRPSLLPSTHPTQCIDDREYRSPINPRFGCELYCGTDCFQWGSLLNVTQLQEIFTRCPDSCKVPCGYTLPLSYMTPSTSRPTSNIPTNPPSLVSHMPSSSGTTSPSHVPSVNSIASPTFVQSNRPTLLPTTLPSIYPSMFPTRCGIPDDQRIVDIFELLQNVTDLRLLLNPDTSQGKAMNWLLYEDTAHLCPNEMYGCQNRIIQRYALAVIYFATGGESWSKCSRSDLNCGTEVPFIGTKNFLSDSHECIWAGIGCTESKCVRVINFENNNMEGTIPSEISSLIHLEYWAMEQGRLQSSIPSTISSLTNLFFLDLDFNFLTGTLPSQLFTLTNLRQLDLNNNTLSGPIDGIENLTKLQFLQLHQNRFTGTIPTALDHLKDLNLMTSYDTKLGGAPDSLCKNRVTNGGLLATLNTNCPCSCCTNGCPAR